MSKDKKYSFLSKHPINIVIDTLVSSFENAAYPFFDPSTKEYALSDDDILSRLSLKDDASIIIDGKCLVKPTLDSNQGNLLALFIKKSTTFLSDTQIAQHFEISDTPVAVKISEIIKYLKRDLKKSGFKLVIKRSRTKDGYRLIDIK